MPKMIAYTKDQIVRLLKIDFIRFCVVGGSGFLVNLTLLTFFHKILQAPLFFSQLISAEIALGCNFTLHHNWTYKHHNVKKTIKSLIIQFHATTWPAILGSALMVVVGVRAFHLSSTLALVLSSFIALFWNFGWSKFVVWRDITDTEIMEVMK